MYSLLCSIIFCHLSGNFIIPPSQFFFFFMFLTKDCSKCILPSSNELNFFPFRKFCKDQNKWKSEGAICSEISGSVRTSSSFAQDWVPWRPKLKACPWGEARRLGKKKKPRSYFPRSFTISKKYPGLGENISRVPKGGQRAFEGRRGSEQVPDCREG